MALIDNILAYWKYDEASGNLLDSVASEDLTDTNTVTAGTGIIAGDRVFTAANSERFTHASDATLERGATSYSFAFWYKPVATNTGEDDIIAKYSSGSDRQYIIYQNNADVVCTIYIGTIGVATIATALSAGTWTFIVGGYDSAANQSFISVNAGAYTTASITGTGVLGSTGEFNIGASLDTGVYYNFINAQVDEMGFWSRKLSDAEVDELYNSGAGFTYPFTSIKTINGLAKASVKVVNGLAIASVKTWNGLA